MNPAFLIPLVAIGGPFGIAVVAILTKHQQKMAELIHSTQNTGVDIRIDALQREISELRSLVNQQSILLDNLATTSSRTEGIQQRVGM